MFKLLKLLFLSLVVVLLALNWRFIALQSGLVKEEIDISGTGSMFPTFPKGTGDNPVDLSKQIVARVQMRRFPAGINLFNLKLFDYQLKTGDIVSFENSVTRSITLEETGVESGFVKRVIGLPGETVEIRDGFVIINGKQLVEPYTAVARSTFGGAFLPDCHPLEIPTGSVLVLGDNRKGSSDSRHDLGLISISDIDHILPYADQEIYEKLWRDASKDYLEANRPTLNTDDYLKLLNAKRVLNSLKPLKYQPKLTKSAGLRADVIMKYDDFSFDATKSGYTMAKAMRDAGYSNIIWGEAPTLGYYDAQELVNNFFQFPDSKKFLLQSDFQETGIVAKVGEINGCPVQIVVQEFAGYKPPNYAKDLITSWQGALDNINKVLPTWQNIKNYPDIYQEHKADYDEIISLFQTRQTRIQSMLTRMQANQWLTSQEEQWMKDDEQLAKRLQTLTEKLNK